MKNTYSATILQDAGDGSGQWILTFTETDENGKERMIGVPKFAPYGDDWDKSLNSVKKTAEKILRNTVGRRAKIEWTDWSNSFRYLFTNEVSA